MSPSYLLRAFLWSLVVLRSANAYWLMSTGIIATERMDPIVNPGTISGHVHSIMGGSNFGYTSSTARLRQSKCTSTPIPQDKSNYWFPHLYFQWGNGSFTSLTGGGVVYYLFSDNVKTTAFPDDFRMLSGDPTLRTENKSSSAQQAVSFLCLDFSGTSTRFTGLPPRACPSGVRAQINMPSCWDGKNVDSPSHNNHVAFPSGGPDSGTCNDPRYPITIPRVFIEVYWNTVDFDKHRSQAKNSAQPFVFSYGDETGYGYHADFFNGWDAGVLQNAVQKCNCNPNGDPTCCAKAGIFDYKSQGSECYITPQVDEIVTGTLPKLPGNNPVLGPKDAVNGHVVLGKDMNPPSALYPPQAFTSKTQMEGACKVSGSSSGCTRGPVPGSGSAPSVPVSVPSSSVVSSSIDTSHAPTSATPSSGSTTSVSSSINVSHLSASGPSGTSPSSSAASKPSGSSTGGSSFTLAPVPIPSESSSVRAPTTEPHASAPVSSATRQPSNSFTVSAISPSSSASSVPGPHGSQGEHSRPGNAGSHGDSDSGHTNSGKYSGHEGHPAWGHSRPGHKHAAHSHPTSGASHPNAHDVHPHSNHSGTCSPGSGRGRKHHAGSYKPRSQ